MKISQSNKLTIILPIKERKEFTKRFFIYLSRINLPYKIIIADGSKNKLSKNILSILKIANINYDYYKFPEDKNYNLYLNKIYKTLTFVKTKYVMLFSDDDFPILYSIERLINYLEKNNAYKIAGGYLINFDILKKSDKNIQEETYGIPIHFSKFFDQRSCNEKNRLARLKFYLTEATETPWHFVFRKDALIKTYKKAKDVKFYNYSFNDWLVDSFNYMSGKIKKINIPILLHQYHYSSEINNRPDLRTIMKEKDFIKDKKYFLSILNRSFAVKKNKIDSFVNIFFSKTKNKLKYSNSIGYKKLIINLLPLFLKKKITNLYRNILNYYLYLNNYHLKFFLKNYLNGKEPHIKKELLFFFNFIKIL